MTSTQAPRGKLIAAFAAIYFIWGSTFLAIKYAIATMPPFALGALRFWIAGMLLFGWSIMRTKVRATRRQWLHAGIVGTFMLAVGNGTVVWAEQRMASGLPALLAAIIPLWVVLADWLRPGGRRPNGKVLIGVVLGLAGIVLLIGPAVLHGSKDVDVTGALVVLMGSLSWSVATVFGRHADVAPNPLLTSSMQLLSGGAVLTVVSLLFGEASHMTGAFTTQSVLALLYLVVFGSIIAFSAYSWLMKVSQPARIATYAYVNPVVAMLLGWAIAGEKLTTTTLVAAGVILSGVALITTGMNRK